MTKIRLALVTGLLALTSMLASTAEAGGVRLQFGFPLGSFTAHGNSGGYSGYARKRRHNYVHREVRSKVKVSKRKAATDSAVAEAQPEVKTEKVKAETENSSISTATIQPTGAAEATPESSETDAAPTGKASDCKKFFPSVGMTLTVPCE